MTKDDLAHEMAWLHGDTIEEATLGVQLLAQHMGIDGEVFTDTTADMVREAYDTESQS